MLNRKQIIAFIGLGVFIILYVVYVFPLAEQFGKFLASKSPVKFFIYAVSLSALLIAVRILKRMKNKKYEKAGDLAQWFALLFSPVSPAIEAIIYKELSLYWIYFPYVVSSVFWISIGVYNGGSNIRNWDPLYRFIFFSGCFILMAIGIIIQINFDAFYQYSPTKFLP